MAVRAEWMALETAAGSNDLEAAPISPNWILDGTPEARSKILVTSRDGTSRIMVWECSAGRFDWHYSEDEIVMVIAGEVFITSERGEEKRLGQGDLALFPAGSSATWRVPDRIKKIAILRKDLPPGLGIGVRAWHIFLRIVGLRGQSPLMPAASH